MFNVVWLAEDKIANGRPGNVFNNIFKNNTAQSRSATCTIVYESSQWSTPRRFGSHSQNSYCAESTCYPILKQYAGDYRGLTLRAWQRQGNDVDSVICAKSQRCQ